MSNHQNTESDSRKLLIKLALWLTIGASLAQVIIECSFPNVAAVVLALASWPIALRTFISEKKFNDAPISSLVVIGFWATQIILPIIATALEGRAVTFNLELTELILLHNSIIFITLVFAWEINRNLVNTSYRLQNTVRFYLNKIGVYAEPPPSFLYFLGLLGLISIFYIKLYLPTIGLVAAGPTQKFIQGLTPFAIAPFLILLTGFLKQKSINSINIIFITLFSLLLVIAAIGENSRATFMNVFLLLGVALGYFILSGTYRGKLICTRNIIITLLSFYLLTGPIADLATSMVIVRSERQEVSRDQLVKLTWETFFNKDKILSYRERETASDTSKNWNLTYISNPLFERFCNLKITDNSLVSELKLDANAQGKYFNFTIERTIATYPRPLLNLLGIRIDKDTLQSYGWGDYLLYLADGSANVLGGFRVVALPGTGMAAFGILYIPLLFVAMIIVFNLISLLEKNDQGKRACTTILFLNLPFLFRFIPNLASLGEVGSFLLRGFWEKVFLYGVLWILYLCIVSVKSLRRA